MTRKYITSIIALLFTTTAIAQTKKVSNAHVGLIYPISSNGTAAPEYTNKFSLHAIGGVSKSEEAFCVSGFGNVINNQANGLIAAGFANLIMGDADGAQLGGFLNIIKSNATGLQAAGFANISGYGNGIQLAGFGNISIDGINGLQAGGFMNIAEDVLGFQGAGFMNIAEDAKGAQVAGFMNAGRDINGVQIAGFMNVAEDVNTQLSGFMNIAKNVKGVQLSGFINIADSSDFPIGFLNISRKGEKYLGVTVDNNLTSLVTFRSGGKYLYGIIGAGANLSYTDPAYALELGLGAHIPIAKIFRFNTEVAVTSLSDYWNTVQLTSSFRLMPALKLGQKIELFAGPTFNYEYSEQYFYNDNNKSYIWHSDNYGYHQRIYIGGLAGLHFDI